MEKQVITADVPETGGPFNLTVKYGNLIFISGLPPFDENYCGDQGPDAAADAPGQRPF
jgi:2-iminobutanoate/2-iminopropanoate deaminase